MSTATGYSIWLMPNGRVYNKLADIIARLSRKYYTPVFEPHVTLIGLISGAEKEVVEKTARLASMLRPYEIKLSKVDHLDEYSRSLFVRAVEMPQVMDANAKAREVFGRQNDPPYMPHLSLVYGNLTLPTKQAIILEIGEEFDFSFDVRSLHLYLTQGEVKDWRKVREFEL